VADYEELVNILRNCVQSANGLNIQAADAIEELCREKKRLEDKTIELQAIADHYEAASQEWFQTACEYKNAAPKWISVDERLPESGTHVLVCCRVKWLGGGGHSYVCDAFHSDSKTIPCSYNDDIDMEYDEEKDEYYFPEGWWEVIKNWDEYSCVAIADFVTHWMPLPEPPKEDA